MKLRVQARYLQIGDIVGSGETVVRTFMDSMTPKGKINVLLYKDDRTRFSEWGIYTMKIFRYLQ